MSSDPILDLLQLRIDVAGYSVMRFDPPHEFPEGCAAARIIGPGLPTEGLPFCVPSERSDIWARRICLALAIAFEKGRTNRRGEG